MKSREVETGCGTVLIIIGGIIIVMVTVLIVLFLTRFGLWPDWAIEFELLVKAALKAWLR